MGGEKPVQVGPEGQREISLYIELLLSRLLNTTGTVFALYYNGVRMATAYFTLHLRKFNVRHCALIII